MMLENQDLSFIFKSSKVRKDLLFMKVEVGFVEYSVLKKPCPKLAQDFVANILQKTKNDYF